MSVTKLFCPDWCNSKGLAHERCISHIRDVLLTVDEPESIADVYLEVSSEGRGTVNLLVGAATHKVSSVPPTARLTAHEARALALALFAAAEDLSGGED